MENTSKYAKSIRVYNAPFGTLSFIRFDALNPEDYPNHLPENSIFVEFRIDRNSVEVNKSGHLWLSEEDKKTDKYKYLAMKSMINAHKDFGGKTFRKQTFKDEEDLRIKMTKYFDAVMDSVVRYAGAYPFSK